MAEEQFKFPDEMDTEENKNAVVAPQNEEGDVDIEVVDDTPPDDRGYPVRQEVSDTTDEELSQYSEKVQARLKALTHARHDERRAKESALREREEFARVAQRLVEENSKLKQYVSSGEQAYAGSLKDAAQAEYEMAKKKFKEAHEAFDADAILEAQSDLLKAQLKLERADSFKPTPLQTSSDQVESVSAAPAVVPDQKTLRWQAQNPWFGQSDPLSDEMTAVALIAHKSLVNSGIDPRSDEYFAHIDARLKKRFPDYFETKTGTSPRSDASEVKKASTVVAPATRSSGAKKVKLTSTQVAIAKRLNVPLELYAKQLAQGSENV